MALGLGQLDPIAYIHLSLLVGGPVESTDESNVWRATIQFHVQARPVSGLHRRLHPRPLPAPRRTRNAALLRRDPALSPPDDSHPRTRWPHPPPTRCPAQHRGSGSSRGPARPGRKHPTSQILCAEVLAPKRRSWRASRRTGSTRRTAVGVGTGENGGDDVGGAPVNWRV